MSRYTGTDWRGRLALPLVWCSLAVPQAAGALTFSEAFQAARAHDASYRSANRELEATKLNEPIARASLLPSISLNASDSSNLGSRRFPNFQNQEVQTRLDYTAPQASLQMRLSLFNYDALNSLRQAKVQSEVAEENYRNQGMDLMDRLSTAYLQLLLSEEGGRLAQSQVETVEAQLAQTRKRLERGEGTKVQVAQLQASLDLAQARLLEARDQIDISRRQLSRLTGEPVGPLMLLSADAPALQVFPDRLGDWLAMAVQQSPSLRARERNIEVARIGVQRQYAGHLPRVDLVSSVSRSESETTNTIGQSTFIKSVGVQMSIPIFSGGGVDAQVRQAEARRQQAEEESRMEREAVEVDVQKYYQAVNNGAAKIDAYRIAVQSTALAWQGAKRSLELGLGTLNEVADAQNAHFVARRDLLQARIDQMVALTRLKIRAGMPMADVASELDAAIAASSQSRETEAKR